MRRVFLRLAGTVAIALTLQIAESRADTLAFTPADSGTLGSSSIAGWGWAPNSLAVDYSFQVTAPIDVTALAYYSMPLNDNPLTRAEIVSIYQAGSSALGLAANPLVSALVSPASLLLNVSTNVNFYYTNIEPFSLTPGVVYQLTEQPAPSPLVNTFFYATTASPASGVSFLSDNKTGAASFGGDFLFATPSAVPEPSTWIMFCLGFAGLGLALRRQKRNANASA